MIARTSTLVLVLLASCEPAPFSLCEGLPSTPSVEGAVWHKDVRPIVEARCGRCHVEGGLAPFALTTLADLKDHLTAVEDAVASRRMPPWQPAKCCNEFKDDASLTPEQIGTITSWIQSGAPAGDPRDVGEPLDTVGALSRVDTTLAMNDAYLPDVAHHDDTRCFMLSWPFAEKKFVTGFNVTPGARKQVHHALVVTAPGAMLSTYQALEDGDDHPGWSCPGGLIGGVDDWIGSWSPGWEGQQMPAGTGHEVLPDDVVILTVHYTRPHEANVDIGEDQTSVDLMLEDEVDDTLMSIAVFNVGWTLGGMSIPKGERDVEYTMEYDPTDTLSGGKPIEIVGVNLHMHERGKSGVVGIRRRDGSQECLIQIDAYDHAWQSDYQFAERRVLEDGDLAYVECHFDNSDSHQRIVDGVPEKPRDLNWGEDQEMCIGFITAIRPR